MSEAAPELDVGGLGHPQTNSAPTDTEPETAEYDLADLPTTEERVAEFIAEYPALAELPISNRDRQKLRSECVDETAVVRTVTPEGEHSSPFTVRDVVARRSRSWAECLRSFLEWYEEYRYMKLRFEKGYSYEDGYEAFEISPENSWQPGYNRRQFAQLKALERQTVGYNTCAECASYFCRRPAEHATDWVAGEFDNPYTILLSRTASTTPTGEQTPPVEHDRQVSEAWQDGVYRSMRYVLEERLGLDRSEWTYWKQGEPHAGGGAASCYGHDHPCIIIDAPASASEASLASEFETVINKHVEVCEWAGAEAHTYDSNDPMRSSISVKKVGDGEGEVRSVASYIAEYVQVDDDSDLLERPVEYLAWATTQWATNTQKAVRSNNANHAVAADLCTQHYHDLDNTQVNRHGEQVVLSDKSGYNFECFECGSPWGVDQNHDTLTEARLSGGSAYDGPVHEAAVVAGPDRRDREVPVRGPDGLETDLKASWPSARSAAVNDGDTVAGFEGPATFNLTSVQLSDGEQHGVSPGGVDMRPLKLPESHRAVWVEETREQLVSDLKAKGVRSETVEMEYRGRFVVVSGQLPTDHPQFIEHGIRELEAARRVPKPPKDDRDELVVDEVVTTDAGAGVRERVDRYVRQELRKNETFTVASVAGALMADPSKVERAVGKLVERGAVLDESEAYRRA